MSTDHELYKDQKHLLSLWEGSSEFTLMVFEQDESRHPKEGDGICIIDFPEGKRLTAEQVVDIAMKMMQPTLYNVEDPKKFFKEVILKKVNSLFV